MRQEEEENLISVNCSTTLPPQLLLLMTQDISLTIFVGTKLEEEEIKYRSREDDRAFFVEN